MCCPRFILTVILYDKNALPICTFCGITPAKFMYHTVWRDRIYASRLIVVADQYIHNNILYTFHQTHFIVYYHVAKSKFSIPDKEIAAFAFWPVSFFSPIDKVPSLLLASTRICLSSRIIRFCTHSTADAHKWGMTSENQTLHCRRQYSKRTLKLFQGVWRELFS